MDSRTHSTPERAGGRARLRHHPHPRNSGVQPVVRGAFNGTPTTQHTINFSCAALVANKIIARGTPKTGTRPRHKPATTPKPSGARPPRQLPPASSKPSPTQATPKPRHSTSPRNSNAKPSLNRGDRPTDRSSPTSWKLGPTRFSPGSHYWLTSGGRLHCPTLF